MIRLGNTYNDYDNNKENLFEPSTISNFQIIFEMSSDKYCLFTLNEYALDHEIFNRILDPTVICIM
jgi:hypothetical protein